MRNKSRLHVIVRTPRGTVLDTRAQAVEVYAAFAKPLILNGPSPSILEALSDTRIVVRGADGRRVAVGVSWGALTVSGHEVRIAARDADLRPLASGTDSEVLALAG